ncbi:hypothetical protein IODZLFCR_CDS0041 [Salmonella phage vB_SalP_SE29]|uniref:Uncharacterized protein n=2 Tax=Molineuxvirinae TaxID=2731650 RepID=A0A977XRV2_9CAUD|nr:hypothetical protein [Salmonella phage PST_H2]
MGVVKKAVKAVSKAVGGVLGADQRPVQVETKVPAQQLARQQEVGAEDIEVGGGDDTSTSSAKGKRGLVRPVASSLGV